MEQLRDGRKVEDGIADRDADPTAWIRRRGKDAVWQVLDRKIRIRRDGNPRHDEKWNGMFLIVRAVVEMDLSLETLRKKMGVKDKLWENIAKRDKKIT